MDINNVIVSMDFYIDACAPQHRMNTIDRTHYHPDRQESLQLQASHLIHDRTIERDILYTRFGGPTSRFS